MPKAMVAQTISPSSRWKRVSASAPVVGVHAGVIGERRVPGVAQGAVASASVVARLAQ